MLFLVQIATALKQSHANTTENKQGQDLTLCVSFLSILSMSRMMLHSLHYIVILNYLQ